MKVVSAEFIKSAVRPEQYPKTGLPEIAFAGRSNVGKSSLINALVGRRKLAQTSATPARRGSLISSPSTAGSALSIFPGTVSPGYPVPRKKAGAPWSRPTSGTASSCAW